MNDNASQFDFGLAILVITVIVLVLIAEIFAVRRENERRRIERERQAHKDWFI